MGAATKRDARTPTDHEAELRALEDSTVFRADDDPVGLLADEELADRVLASATSVSQYRAAFRAAALERMPELAELGDDPDGAVRAAELAIAQYGLGLSLPIRLPTPAPMRPLERLWLRLMKVRDAAAQRRIDEGLWQHERRARIDRIGAPLRPRDVHLLKSERLVDTPPLRALERWSERGAARRPILMLLGAAGVGKTLAAVRWATSTSRTHAGAYVTMGALSSHWTAHYGSPDDEFRSAVRTRLLVVDELGWERSEAARSRNAEILFELINQRGRAPFQTVMISNRPLDGDGGFLAHYAEVGGERNDPLIDRMRSDVRVVELAGESLRPGRL